MSQKYVIAHFLEQQVPRTNFSATEWPLHVTLLPLFSMAWSVDKLTRELAKLAANTNSFDIESGEQALFGVNRDVHVSLVQPSKEILQLHQKLFELCSGAEFNYDTPRFMGEGYKPHITNDADNPINSGQKFRLANMTLVDMYPGNDISRRAIIDTFDLAD